MDRHREPPRYECFVAKGGRQSELKGRVGADFLFDDAQLAGARQRTQAFGVHHAGERLRAPGLGRGVNPPFRFGFDRRGQPAHREPQPS
jgi:hypothetical protein